MKIGAFATDQHGGRVQVLKELDHGLVEVRARTSDRTRIVPISSLKGEALRPERSRTTTQSRPSRPVSQEEVMQSTALTADDLTFADRKVEGDNELKVATVEDIYSVEVSIEDKGKTFNWKVIRQLEGQEPEVIDSHERFEYKNRGMSQAVRMAVLALNKDRRTRAKSSAKVAREAKTAEPETQPAEPQVGDSGPEGAEAEASGSNGNTASAEPETPTTEDTAEEAEEPGKGRGKEKQPA